MTLIYVIRASVSLLLTALTALIVIRSLYQLFVDEEDAGLFYSFLYAATEPVLYPVRSALLRTELFSSLPIDFSAMITVGLLSFITLFL